MKLIEAYEVFRAEYSNEQTKRAYRYILEPFISHIGQGWDASEIEQIALRRYIQQLKAGEVRGINGENINLKSPHSVYKHIKGLKRFFNWLVEVEVLASSPARNIPNPAPDSKIASSKAATPKEIRELLKVAYGNPRAYAIAMFFVDTGARAQGVVNLTISEVDLANLTATVHEKFGKSRPVFYTSEAANAMREWLVNRPICDHDYFFTQIQGVHKGKPMTADAVRAIISRVFKKCGVTHGTHAIRHFVGFQLSDAGISPTVAATILGHDNPETTMNHYYPHDFERAEQAIRSIQRKRQALYDPTPEPLQIRRKKAK